MKRRSRQSVEEAVSILNQETFTIDLELLDQWCNGEKSLLPPEVISEVLKQADPHKAILFYLWTGRRCQKQMVRKLLDEGWFERAIKLVDDNQETYRMVVSELHDEKLIRKVVSKMRQHGCTLDAESFKKVSNIIAQPELIECYKEMVAECSTSPDTQVCEIVLNAMLTQQKFQEACELVKYMVARGFKPWLPRLFNGLVEAGMYDDAYNVLEAVDDEEAHNDLIRALGCDNLDKIGELVKRMLARGYTPYVMSFFEGLLATGRDKDAYAALEMVGGEVAHCDFIRAFLKLRRLEDAYQFVEGMFGRHPEHMEKCFNTLVHELFEYTLPNGRSAKVQESKRVTKVLVEALDLMDVAVATAGITPDTKSYIAVANALEISGRRKEALYIFKFVKLGGPFTPSYSHAYSKLHGLM